MKKPFGMTNAMFQSYISAMFLAGIDPEKRGDGGKRIVQTAPKTNAQKVKASGCTHDIQGELDGEPFGCAVDIGIKDLSAAEIKKMLLKLAEHGYVGWYRYLPPFDGDKRHVHVVYVGHYVKDQCVWNQIVAYLKNRTGLKGNAQEKFFTAPTSIDKLLAQRFVAANPDKKKQVPKDLLL